MAAATQWRMIGIQTQGGGDLEILTFALFSGATRVDAAATLTSSHTPQSGSLSALQNTSNSTPVRISGDVVRSGGFWLQWDFASPQDLSTAQVTRAAPATALECVTIQQMQGGTWTTITTQYADPSASVSTLITTPPGDALMGWLASCAALSQAGGSDRWDPADTAHPKWAERFSAFAGVGAYATATTTTPVVTKTISRFIPDEKWMVYAGNPTYISDYAQLDVEFMAGASVVAALSCRKNANFSSAIYVGSSLGTLTLQPVYGANQTVNGLLVASNGGIRYTPTAGTSANTSAFFYAINLSSVTALRITVRAYTGYTAAWSIAAAARLEVLKAGAQGLDPPAPRGSTRASTGVAASAPVPAFKILKIPALATARDIEFGGGGNIYGTTKTKGTPNLPTKARVVLLHQRSKLPVRETWSDPTTGAFAFASIDTAQKFITLAEDANGDYRPVAANKLTPEVLP